MQSLWTFSGSEDLWVGCPRNNHIFFFGSNQNEPKLNLLRLFVSFLRETKQIFFRFVSVFRTGIETTETNRNKPKKISKKQISIRVSSKQLTFFRSNRNNLKLNLFWLFFGLFFRETKQNFFVLFRCFGLVLKQPKQTELMVWGIKKVHILTNLLLFRLSFVCFGCFETPKLPALILKRNNRNKRLVWYSAETSFGSSFGCFDTKVISEDTLSVS